MSCDASQPQPRTNTKDANSPELSGSLRSTLPSPSNSPQRLKQPVKHSNNIVNRVFRHLRRRPKPRRSSPATELLWASKSPATPAPATQTRSATHTASPPFYASAEDPPCSRPPAKRPVIRQPHSLPQEAPP